MFSVSASDGASGIGEHREELKQMIQDFRETVILPKLEEWFGDEIPESPRALRGSLTEDQRLELRELRQNFRETEVLPQLEEWGIEPYGEQRAGKAAPGDRTLLDHPLASATG